MRRKRQLRLRRLLQLLLRDGCSGSNALRRRLLLRKTKSGRHSAVIAARVRSSDITRSICSRLFRLAKPYAYPSLDTETANDTKPTDTMNPTGPGQGNTVTVGRSR